MIKKTISQTIKILLILLAAAVVVSGLWFITNGNGAGGAAANGAADESTASEDIPEGDSVAGFTYYHYDTAAFDEMCAKLADASEANDSDTVLSTYDELYSEFEELETLYSAAYILYSMDMDDEYYTEEQNYAYNTLVKCEDKLSTICHDIALSPNAEAFREHVGDQAFSEFEEYKPYTDREKEIIEAEQKLVDDYYDLYTDPEITYEYNGTVWDLDMIDGEEGDELYYSNSTDYYTVEEEIEKKFNEKAGPIFKEMIDLRNEFARGRGFDDYVAYADKLEYSRDYTDAEIAQLYVDVKKISKEFIPMLYAFYQNSDEELPAMSNKELLDTLCKYSEQTGRTAGDAASKLKNEGLYSIDDGKSRQPGGYTSYLQKIEKPFIFITKDADENILPTLTHEFGHFTEDIVDERNNGLTDSDSIDLAEIASNGYECLFSHYYDEIFPGQANYARKDIIEELMENIIFGCIGDEFQREVYRNPDLTVEDMNRLYARIYRDYGLSAGDQEYSWEYVSHFFEMPMYYISYAVSGLAAVQIWEKSNTDFEGAVATWEKFLKEGVYNKTYLDVVGRCGLLKFTEPGAVDAICEPAVDAFRE